MMYARWMSAVARLVRLSLPASLLLGAGALLAQPTATPTPIPTSQPTAAPTPGPTQQPTATPTPGPTNQPTATPTPQPTAQPTATATPTPFPTNDPMPTEPPSNQVPEPSSLLLALTALGTAVLLARIGRSR